MCLAVPAKIIEINGDMAITEIEGVRRECNVCLVENPQIGEHVLIHAGFAIQKWTDEDVKEFHDIMGEIQDAQDGK